MAKDSQCYGTLKSLIWDKIETKWLYVLEVWCLSCSFWSHRATKLGSISIKSLHNPQKETLISCIELFQMHDDRRQHLRRSLRTDKDAVFCGKKKRKIERLKRIKPMLWQR